MRNFGFGPGGRAGRFRGNKLIATRYSPRTPRMRLIVIEKLIIVLEDPNVNIARVMRRLLAL